MDKKEITCIVCPIGCKILVKTDGKSFECLDGYKCKKGIEYAHSEALDPRRMLTSSILVKGGEWPLVSVKTSKPVPKNKIFSILKIMRKTIAPTLNDDGDKNSLICFIKVDMMLSIGIKL